MLKCGHQAKFRKKEKQKMRTDKIKESGLLPLTTPDGNVTFEQARLTLECRKLYGQLLSPEHFIDKSLPDKWYGAQGNFHKVYVVEILKVWEK